MREIERLKAEIVMLTEQRKNALDIVKAKEEESESLKEELSRMRQDRRDATDKEEREFGRRMQQLDAQWNAKLQDTIRAKETEMHTLRSEIQMKEMEIQRLRSESDAAVRALEQQQHLELGAINDKVLVTISKKDESIRGLTERVRSLEYQLQQRTLELARQQELLNS